VPGFVDIGDARFSLTSGLESLEIIDEYGFVASVASIELNLSKVQNNAPEVFDHAHEDNILIDAYIELPNGVRHFRGILDDVGGTINKFEPPQNNLSVTGRSILSVLLDESDKNSFSKTYENKDWSLVVRDVITRFGFSADFVQSAGVQAGEAVGRVNLFTVDEQTAGEIIDEAVSATGFVANTTAEKKFIFAPSFVPDDYYPAMFTFLPETDDGDIETATFSDGNIESFVVKESAELIVPGAKVNLIITDKERLAGTYFVTKVRYVTSRQDGADLAEYSVARELPELKDEESG